MTKNYLFAIYNSIISNAQTQDRKKLNIQDPNYAYYENHHILPKALGGSNKGENLVLLSSREHFICHRLLAKIHGGPMIRALWCMIHLGNRTNRHQNYTKLTSREYTRLREDFAKNCSGKNHPGFGKKRIFSETHKENMRVAQSKVVRVPYTDKQLKNYSEKSSGKNNAMYGLKGKDHPAFGYSQSKEQRAATSLRMTGKNNPRYGVKPSKEQNDKQSKFMLENNPMRGKHHTETSKLKCALSKQKHIIHTPFGKFINYSLAARAIGISAITVSNKVKSPDHISKIGKHKGLTHKQQGWFETKLSTRN